MFLVVLVTWLSYLRNCSNSTQQLRSGRLTSIASTSQSILRNFHGKLHIKAYYYLGFWRAQRRFENVKPGFALIKVHSLTKKQARIC